MNRPPWLMRGIWHCQVFTQSPWKHTVKWELNANTRFLFAYIHTRWVAFWIDVALPPSDLLGIYWEIWGPKTDG